MLSAPRGRRPPPVLCYSLAAADVTRLPGRALQVLQSRTRMAAAKRDLELWGRVAAAIGGSVEVVASMQEGERQELVKVLGFVVVEVQSRYRLYSTC